MAPLDEGDYSPVDDESHQNTESQISIVGKVQQTAEKFNNLIHNQKISSDSTTFASEKEMNGKNLKIGMRKSSDTQKHLKDFINGSSSGIDSTVDSGIGQLSSNSLSGTSVSGSISSSNSSSSTSPQDSHNDSGYSTRVGYSAGPSPSLSGNCVIFIILLSI